MSGSRVARGTPTGAHRSGPINRARTLNVLNALSPGDRDARSPPNPSPQAGNDVFDLGEALYGFLLRYAEEFDYGMGEFDRIGSGQILSGLWMGCV